ncbi:MAG: PKD domain-containing protein, partial [bacterium]
NIGDGTGWTGYDYVHAGQTVANDVLLHRVALQSNAFRFRVAVLIKYTDPRGRGGRARRFPAEPADVLEFAYRCPFADLDNSKVTLDPAPIDIQSSTGSTTPVTFDVRDWDVSSSEAPDADLSDEGDVSLIQPGASGTATASIDAPFLSAIPQVIVPGGSASGVPGDEVPFAGTLNNVLGTATAGDYVALLQLLDPEDGDPAAVSYHKGVDPNTLTPDPARALSVRTYQAIPVHVTQGIVAPTITAVSPTGTVGISGSQVSFSATTTGDPVDTWSWNFNGGGSPNTSANAAPVETLGAAGTYASASVTASNAGGTSAPFTFSYTVTAAGTPPTWQIHSVVGCKDQYQALAVLNGKLAIGYATNSGTADFRFAQASVATPTSSAQWIFQDVDTPNETGYTPTAIVQPNGMIALAFRDWTNKDLRIARALTTTPSGPGDWQVHAADTTGDVGHYTSVCIANGMLAVAHTSFDSPNRPRFSRATTVTPTSSADWQSYDLESNTGGYTPSLIEFNGRLALLFSTSAALRYGRAQIVNPASAANWTLYDVESAPAGGDDWPSLAVHGGNLAAAYCARGGGDLKLARALIAEPISAGDWSLYIIDAAGDTGYFPSMVELGGRLAISYMDFPNKDFRMARATIANPTSGGDWQTQLVDSGAPWTGGTTRLVVLGSVFAASYYDITSQSVKVAISSSGW